MTRDALFWVLCLGASNMIFVSASSALFGIGTRQREDFSKPDGNAYLGCRSKANQLGLLTWKRPMACFRSSRTKRRESCHLGPLLPKRTILEGGYANLTNSCFINFISFVKAATSHQTS